MLIRKAAR